MLRDMRDGNLDVVAWVSPAAPAFEARHSWAEDLVWVRGATLKLDDDAPVPLVSYGDECPFTRSMVAALNSIGRDSELAFMGSSVAGIGAAVASGLGISALPRNSANLPGMIVWDDVPLPKLPEIFCGIYVRPGGDSRDREQLADTLATALRMKRHVGGELQHIERTKVPAAG